MFSFKVIFIFLFSASDTIKYKPSNNFWENSFSKNLEEHFQFVESIQKDDSVYRLPRTIQPISYILQICPFLEGDFPFKGEVSIKVFSKEYTNIVKLHSYKLKIVEAHVRTGTEEWSPIEHSLDTKNQLLILNLKSYFFQSNNLYDLRISFEGQLNNDMLGFYRSSYKVGDSVEWLAVTQFESTFARYAFPCFDEPQFKANFKISIARYENQIALSNMPLHETSKSDSSINNRVWDTFEETPKMPTYLVAFMVSNFKPISRTDKIKVWARPNVIEDGNYACTVAEKVIKEMEDFTGIMYDLPKMDMAAIPDFYAGAMENWGFTTYRERYLLYNNKISTEHSKEFIAIIIAHELTHQWFGDYVTPIWWSYLWLKEGFATYFEYHIMDKIEPTWMTKEFFVPEMCQYALYNDGAYAYHPLNSEIQSLEDIRGIYDVISYHKGGCIIRMLEHMVSTFTFKKALHTFLKIGHAMDGLVTPDILWKAFDTQIKLDSVYLPDQYNISSIMETWTDNVGYPLITTRRIIKDKAVDVIIKQMDYNSPRSSFVSKNSHWIVPLTYTTKYKMNFDDTLPTIWSLPGEDIILEKLIGLSDWIILNIQQTGYYRVNYDRKNWKLLTKQLKKNPNVIHHLNRAQLIDDSIYLATDDKLPFAITFDLLNYLKNEVNTIPWFTALYKLCNMYIQFQATDVEANLKDYILRLIGYIYERVGFVTNEEDPHLTKVFRSLLMVAACNLNHSDCVEQAKTEYKKNKNDISKIESNVKEAVFCTVMKSDENEIMWNKMWTLYHSSNVAHEKESILKTLGCTKNRVLLNKYLSKLLDDNDKDIRPQDESYVYESTFSSPEGVTFGLNFIYDLIPNLDKLSKTAYQKIITTLNYLKRKIKMETHMELLSKLISKSKELDQKRYADFVNTLSHMQTSASNRIAYNNKKSEQISFGLLGIILEPKTSSAPSLIPVMLHCLLFLCVMSVLIYQILLM